MPNGSRVRLASVCVISATPARLKALRLFGLKGQAKLVPLHRRIDGLIVTGTEGRSHSGIAQHLDASGCAGAASDQPIAFQRDHHQVDRRRRHLEESLQIGFGRRSADHQRVGMDEG